MKVLLLDPQVYGMNNIIVNILRIFCYLQSCGYGHAVITVNSDIACDATLKGKILGATRDFK